MATIINNPGSSEGDGGASAVILAIIIGVLILGGLFVMYRLPALQGDNSEGGTTIEVPDKVEIDVNSGGAGDSDAN